MYYDVKKISIGLMGESVIFHPHLPNYFLYLHKKLLYRLEIVILIRKLYYQIRCLKREMFLDLDDDVFPTIQCQC